MSIQDTMKGDGMCNDRHPRQGLARPSTLFRMSLRQGLKRKARRARGRASDGLGAPIAGARGQRDRGPPRSLVDLLIYRLVDLTISQSINKSTNQQITKWTVEPQGFEPWSRVDNSASSTCLVVFGCRVWPGRQQPNHTLVAL